jgi:hypothetical protein
MENKGSKPRFMENVRWTLRGLRIVTRVSPAYLPSLLGQSFITAFVPMMQLFFSARILNELAGGRNVAAITGFVAATVLLSFILASLRATLTREVDLSTFWLAYADILGLEAEQLPGWTIHIQKTAGYRKNWRSWTPRRVATAWA